MADGSVYCDSGVCLGRLCCYASLDDGLSYFDVFVEMPGKPVSTTRLSNTNCEATWEGNEFHITCKCEGKCIIQADYKVISQ
jgi:hypothetical protein